MKRYIINIGKSTEQQEENFIKFLNESNVAWWHWLSNFWLVTDPNENFSSSILRDKAVELFNKERVIVIELNDDGDTWSGFGPKTDEKDMFKWVKNNWQDK